MTTYETKLGTAKITSGRQLVNGVWGVQGQLADGPMTKVTAELGTQPRFVQVHDEDDNLRDVQSGFYVTALVTVKAGQQQFTYQPEWFKTEEAANALIDRLCGHPSNAYRAEIETDGPDWMFTGASY